ncbi:histidine phosphatase family protein [Lactiplantibacillus herbarum]|uniref:histidine phosphatase family protein n=1 Tax=Lactiplantibacillus herbarum TaxID=1670446 RepID=UPI00064E82EC|nr:histidine phosphatase family protein [Lactiplantibacillus herbarum]
MTTFYLIRHGQTAANAQQLKQGTIDTPITYLNTVGQRQATVLHDAFDISFADRLICSPLKRTRTTAAILNRGRGVPVSVDERLLEISYGQWDGCQNKQLLADYPQHFDPLLQDVLPSYVQVATAGETFEHVISRGRAFMMEMVAMHPDDQIIVVTHGFTVKAMVLACLEPADLMSLPEPENTSVTKVTIDAGHHRAYLNYYNRQVEF